MIATLIYRAINNGTMKKNYELYKKLNDLVFPFVQKPVRYIGLEMGTVVKDIDNIPLKFALAFPDFYELGMSHIGMGIIYDILNSKDHIACERVYLPYPDMNLKLKENNIPLFSLESFKEIKKFDIIGFSLQYELSYTNILLMLELSNIPVFSKDRGLNDPFVGAGGPCAFNPLPLKDFMDFFIIGDGEITSVAICDTVLKAKNDFSAGIVPEKNFRVYVKKELAKIRGVYVPEYSKNIKKSILYDINLNGYINKHIVPLIETIHNRLSIEIARGCSSGCRFCQAGYIYRPVRERKKEEVINAVKNGLQDTGLAEISLSSLSTGDYSDIGEILSKLSDITSEERVSMSFPSMRIGSLSKDILEKTAEVKKTNFTLAPEAGTQRLRNIINKDISEDDLLKEAADLFRMGFKSLKLYFMIGLPFERIADLDGIRSLVLKIKKNARGLKITVNVNNFVPKPHTPFQWYPMEKEPELTFKINYLRKLLKPLNVNFRYQDPKVSFIEGLISRGDNFTSKIIYEAYKLGAVYDSESKLLNYNAWIKALESGGGKSGRSNFNNLTNRYLYSEKDLDSPLPWDFIDILVDKEYFKSEFKKSYEENSKSIYYMDVNNASKLLTKNCRKVCYLCGVCDFKTISPIYSSKTNNCGSQASDETANRMGGNKGCSDNGNIGGALEPYYELNIRYSKKGDMKYLGHLETGKILLKAFRIVKLPIVYGKSKFSSKPKISFSNPIPFMSESENLYVRVKVRKDTAICGLGELMENMNRFLPDGITVLEILKN